MLLSVTAQLSYGQDAEMKRILDSWEKRQRSIACVKYVAEGTLHIPKDFIEPGLPPEERISPQRRVYYLDFQANRARREERREVHHDELGFLFATAINMYDGKTFLTYEPKQENYDLQSGKWKYNAELKIQAPHAHAQFFEAGDLPVFFAHANFENRFVPTVGDYRRLRNPVDRAYYRKQGAAVRDGARCIVLRSGTNAQHEHYDVWVDPTCDDLPVKVIYYNQNQVTIVWELWYDRAPSGEVQLQRFRCGRPWEAGTILYTDDLRVVEWEVNPDFSPDMFHMTAAPGMIVGDGDKDIRYRKGDGKTADRDVRQLYLQEQRSQRSWVIISIAATLFIVAGASVAIWRRRSRKH